MINDNSLYLGFLLYIPSVAHSFQDTYPVHILLYLYLIIPFVKAIVSGIGF